MIDDVWYNGVMTNSMIDYISDDDIERATFAIDDAIEEFQNDSKTPLTADELTATAFAAFLTKMLPDAQIEYDARSISLNIQFN